MQVMIGYCHCCYGGHPEPQSVRAKVAVFCKRAGIHQHPIKISDSIVGCGHACSTPSIS
jgi:hypothetical protein